MMGDKLEAMAAAAPKEFDHGGQPPTYKSVEETYLAACWGPHEPAEMRGSPRTIAVLAEAVPNPYHMPFEQWNGARIIRDRSVPDGEIRFIHRDRPEFNTKLIGVKI